MSAREKFEAWFYASKYAQVVNPSSCDMQRGWDAWQAAEAESAAEIADLRRQLEDARKALATCETGGYCDVDGDFCKTYWFDEALVKAAINVAMKEQK